ncbi:hypothetical protein DFP73DRAFT_52979 [Morchella snyderi]|nr:hypothetical protein DFP73DRAFT_52979 [Morchella snyderi]
MAQGIVYTLGIIIAILLLLMFLRSVLLRRQRLAIATLSCPPQHPPPPSVPDVGMDVIRPEPAVTNPHIRTYRCPHDEQLPLYEAPPPGYDMVPKYVDLERGGGGGARGGSGDFGESSSAASASSAVPPPGYALEGGSAPGAAPVNLPAAAAPGTRTLFMVDVRRAWRGFGR